MRALRNIFAAVGLALATLAAVSLSVYALTNPPTFAPRMFQTQQVHYIRFSANFNSCTLASGTCSFKIGALPYNAWLSTVQQQITTSFNSGSTDTIAIGISSGGAQIVAAQSVHGAAGDAAALTVIHPGIVTTGNLATSTGADGGFDVWVTYASGGGAPTAGAAQYVLTYFAPNDGSCAPVPLGSTAGPC